MDDLQIPRSRLTFQSLPVEIREMIYVWYFFPLTFSIPDSKLRTISLDSFDSSLPPICWVSQKVQEESCRVLLHSYIPRIWYFDPLEPLPQSFKAKMKILAITVRSVWAVFPQTSEEQASQWIISIDGQDARSQLEQFRAQLPMLEDLDLTLHFDKPIMTKDSYRGIASSLARILEPLLSLNRRMITFFNHCESYVAREAGTLEVELEAAHGVRLIERG